MFVRGGDITRGRPNYVRDSASLTDLRALILGSGIGDQGHSCSRPNSTRRESGRARLESEALRRQLCLFAFIHHVFSCLYSFVCLFATRSELHSSRRPPTINRNYEPPDGSGEHVSGGCRASRGRRTRDRFLAPRTNKTQRDEMRRNATQPDEARLLSCAEPSCPASRRLVGAGVSSRVGRLALQRADSSRPSSESRCLSIQILEK